MMTKIISILVSILMFISPELPAFLDLPAIAKGQELKLDERFELVWEDEFVGDELDTTKWDDNQSVSTLHWGPIRKGGYWHKDMIDVRDGNLVITGQSGIQDKDSHIRTKEEMDAVWGISFEARHASKPEIIPYGKGKFCVVPDSFAYPLDEKDIASMFKTDCAKYNFNSEQLPYLLTRHAPFVIVAPNPPGLQRESNITELYHGLMDRSPELMELFNTLSPRVFSTELPEGIIASPCCSQQEKSITIRLLNTTDALIVNDKNNIISRKDTVVWKKWQGGDGRITITMAKDEKIAKAIYSDLSLQERSLVCELKDKEQNTWEIILPAGLLEDFGYITLSLA